MEIKIDDNLPGKERRIEVEKQFLDYAIKFCGKNKEQISEFMGLSRKKVYLLFKKYGYLKLKAPKEVMTWIKENIKMFNYMEHDQKEAVINTVKENFDDLFYERVKFIDVYEHKVGKRLHSVK